MENRIGKAVLLDARDAAVYTGEIIEPYTTKGGHIPTAKSLPTRRTKIGSIKTRVNWENWLEYYDKDREVIVYRGVGYASSWWFVLTQMLGYKNVKFYDGSAQEWTKYHDMTLN